MNTETYLNHPTFGLLFRVCVIDEGKEIFTTLYAHRLFFLVLTPTKGPREFQSMNRSEARSLVETRMRLLRQKGNTPEFQTLQGTFKILF